MKFAAYVALILLYKWCKFGEKICNNSRYRIFPRGLYFGGPVVSMTIVAVFGRFRRL